MQERSLVAKLFIVYSHLVILIAWLSSLAAQLVSLLLVDLAGVRGAPSF